MSSRSSCRWVTLEPQEVQWMLAHGRVARKRLIIQDDTRISYTYDSPVERKIESMYANLRVDERYVAWVPPVDLPEIGDPPEGLVFMPYVPIYRYTEDVPREEVDISLNDDGDLVYRFLRNEVFFDEEGNFLERKRTRIPYPFGKRGELLMVKERFDLQDGQVIFPKSGGRQARRMPKSAARYWVKLIRSEIIPLQISNTMAHGLGEPVVGLSGMLNQNFERAFQHRNSSHRNTAMLWNGVYALIRKKT